MNVNPNDIVNKIFGEWTILSFSHLGLYSKEPNHIFYICECSCGTKRCLPRKTLIGNFSKSCGCVRKNKLINREYIPKFPVGTKQHMLTILECIKNKNNNKYKIQCDCGKIRIINTTYFNRIQSCGCLVKEQVIGSKSPLWKHGDIFLSYMNRYILSAKKRKLAFELTFKEFKQIVIQNCFYCGEIPKGILQSKYLLIANGIDRKDPKIGYLINNCVPACKICNWAKQDLNCEDFISLVKQIAKHHQSS